MKTTPEIQTEEDKTNELELYIRWWQLNTFLPIVHFLKPPMAFPKAKVHNY